MLRRQRYLRRSFERLLIVGICALGLGLLAPPVYLVAKFGNLVITTAWTGSGAPPDGATLTAAELETAIKRVLENDPFATSVQVVAEARLDKGGLRLTQRYVDACAPGGDEAGFRARKELRRIIDPQEISSIAFFEVAEDRDHTSILMVPDRPTRDARAEAWRLFQQALRDAPAPRDAGTRARITQDWHNRLDASGVATRESAIFCDGVAIPEYVMISADGLFLNSDHPDLPAIARSLDALRLDLR